MAIMHLGNISVSNISTASQSRLNLILNILARLMSCCLCLAVSSVSSIWMMCHVSSCLSLVQTVLARLVSWHQCFGKCLCLGKSVLIPSVTCTHASTYEQLCERRKPLRCIQYALEHTPPWSQPDRLAVQCHLTATQRMRRWLTELEQQDLCINIHISPSSFLQRI